MPSTQDDLSRLLDPTYLDGVVVAYADASLTYAYDRTPNGAFTIELHP